LALLCMRIHSSLCGRRSALPSARQDQQDQQDRKASLALPQVGSITSRTSQDRLLLTC